MAKKKILTLGEDVAWLALGLLAANLVLDLRGLAQYLSLVGMIIATAVLVTISHARMWQLGYEDGTRETRARVAETIRRNFDWLCRKTTTSAGVAEAIDAVVVRR